MWDAIPSNIKNAITVSISVLCFALFYLLLGYGLVKSVITAITLVTILAFLIGKFLWRYLYFDALNQYLCPDLNGEWNAKIESNFEEGTVVQFPIFIKADFFSIKMLGNTSVGKSAANNCRIFKNESDQFELEYFFKVKNDDYKKGDTQFYEGAARLTLDSNKLDSLWEGVYWTNRCRVEGKNTAGKIELSRPKS
jgi:hypothetical protein